MAQLGNILRLTLLEARTEEARGLLSWARGPRDERVTVTWRAEERRRRGAEHEVLVVAEGEMTGDEVLWWAGWFGDAGKVRSLPTRLGDSPCEPVARLWTPIAGPRVEWFVWPEPLGGLAVMALFTPDEARPWETVRVETSISVEDLAAFGRALETEYRALPR